MNTHFTSIRKVALILAMTSCAAATHAAGTITFGNSGLTKMQLYQAGGTTVPVPTYAQIVYGVFWGTNRDELTLVLPLGANSTAFAGGIAAPTSSAYAIPGTEGGQTVFMQIKGWPASFGTNWMAAQSSWNGYGETRVLQITLRGEAGPGTVIWQSAVGTNHNRFYPLVLNTPLTPPVFVSLGNPGEYPSTNSVDEGNQGTVDVVVSVRRGLMLGTYSNALNYITSRVLLTTEDVTATGGQDYVHTNVLVTFLPGETERHVVIKVTGDALPEPVEQFRIRMVASPDFIILSSPLTINIREVRVGSVKMLGATGDVSFPTTAWQRYAVEASADFASWFTLPGVEAIQGTGEIVHVPDALTSCCEQRFYRLRLVP